MAKAKENKVIKIINVHQPLNQATDLRDFMLKELGLKREDIRNVRILRRSMDARQDRIDYVYTLAVSIETETAVLDKILNRKDVTLYCEKKIEKPLIVSGRKTRPVIVGCGPAGLFAALTLVQRGLRPIVIEQGQRIAERVGAVESFWKAGKLNPESNMLFGEGGAGTFSDGKLFTRIKSPLKEIVLKELVKAGADEELLYIAKPHLGTDRLRKIIPCMVEELKRKGVQFLFNTPLTDIDTAGAKVKGVRAGKDFIKAEHIFLAAGHSSRDIYKLLQNKNVRMEPKAFAVGLRIEHPQEFIDKAQLGRWAGNPEIGPADYFLSFKDKESGRGIYTFCMCPGGYVIGCSSSAGEVCTNGMSAQARNSGRANAAVVVTVRPDDFPGSSVLKGVEFQSQLEKAAFRMGGRQYFAPIQKAAVFVGEESEALPDKNITCSYRPGVVRADLRSLLPEFIGKPLHRGLINFEQKMPGFIREGLLVGVETRTSSPIRVLRNPKNYHALGLEGLVPVGEGAGYAGGIVSSAVDGIRAAMRFD